MDTTYRQMTAEHLGPEATKADLERFQAACARYQARVGCTDMEATDHIWHDGNFWDRQEAELAEAE